jgi:glycosyltransferase involved in cell wall biosynthesis
MKPVIVLAGKLHPYGGVETHIFHYCKFMAEAGVDVSLLITSTIYAPEAKQALIEMGIKLSEFDCRQGLTSVLEYARCLQALRLRSESAPVFYSHGASGFVYWASKAVKPSRWVHHHHGDVGPSLDLSFSRAYERTLRKADWLIACTRDHTRLLDRDYSRGGRTVFLPLCKTEPMETSRNVQRARAKLVVGFFGRLRESKGVRSLIELAPWFLAQDIECRLHGDDCEGLMAEGLPPGISWLGAYDSARDVDSLLADVDMVVLPTKFPEGLPIVMSEAISRGVPVVAYPGGGLREMESFHQGIIIVPPDIESLKAGILRMKERLREPDLGKSLAEKYREELGNRKVLDWWAKLLSPISD